MDIDEFLEQDIAEFLDAIPQAAQDSRKALLDSAPTAFMTRDYEKEFLSAIDAGNPTHAKRVLHDLKEKFDEYPQGTPEKQQMKALLLALYEKFREHVETEHLVGRMDDALEGRKPLLQEPAVRDLATPPPPPTPILARKQVTMRSAAPKVVVEKPVETPTAPVRSSMAVSASAQKKSPPPAQRDVPPRESEHAVRARALLDSVEERLAKGDLAQAMQEYRKTRQDVLALDDVPDDLAQRFVTLHTRITAAVREHKARKNEIELPKSQHEQTPARAETAPAAAAPAAASAQRSLDKELLVQLEKHKHELNGHLQRSEYALAMRTYRAMRVIVHQISDAKEAESAARKLVRIYEIIDALRKHPGTHEQRLVREVP